MKYFHSELLKLNDNKDIKITLNGNILEFEGKEKLFTLTELESNSSYQFKALFSPVANSLKYFGKGYLTCTLYPGKNGTYMLTELESVKNPGFVWRVFIKILTYIMMLQSNRYEKEFISKIEQNA